MGRPRHEAASQLLNYLIAHEVNNLFLCFYSEFRALCFKPSKVAARLSLADWLLVVLLGTGTSVSSSTDAITAATVALVRAFIIGDMVARLML